MTVGMHNLVSNAYAEKTTVQVVTLCLEAEAFAADADVVEIEVYFNPINNPARRESGDIGPLSRKITLRHSDLDKLGVY